MTEKQKIFVEEYIKTNDVVQAYKNAYPGTKSESTAQKQGEKLLKKPEIKYYAEKGGAGGVADSKEVMEYLTSVMRRSQSDKVLVTCREEKTLFVPDEKGRQQKQVVKKEEKKLVEVPVKVSDASKAAELLGKRYSLFTDKIQFDGTTAVHITDDIPDSEDYENDHSGGEADGKAQ